MGAFSKFAPLAFVTAQSLRSIRPLRSLIDGGAMVFMLHRVGDIDPLGLTPNEELKVSPAYLEFFVSYFIKRGYRFVSLDDLANVVKIGESTDRLISLGFDDGYRDNLTVALPILERFGVPFTVYVTDAMPDGTACLWWYALGSYILANNTFKARDGREYSCRTLQKKEKVFLDLRDRVLALDHSQICDYFRDYLPNFKMFESEGNSAKYSLSWDEVMELSSSPLVTIGSHTISHRVLSRLSAEEAKREILGSMANISRKIGIPISHVAFPFGGSGEAGQREYEICRDLGCISAATTLPGSLKRGDFEALYRIPRIFVREGSDPSRLIAENSVKAMYRRITRKESW